AQGRTDLVARDLQRLALGAVVLLPLAQRQASGHDDAAALGQGRGRVLCCLTPDVAAEADGLAVLPLVALLHAVRAEQGEVQDRLATGDEPEFRLADVPRDGDDWLIRHRSLLALSLPRC